MSAEIIDFAQARKKRENQRRDEKCKTSKDILQRLSVSNIPESALWHHLHPNSQRFFAEFLHTLTVSREGGHFTFNLGTLMEQRGVIRLWDDGYVIGFSDRPDNQSMILARPHFGLALLSRLKDGQEDV